MEVKLYIGCEMLLLVKIFLNKEGEVGISKTPGDSNRSGTHTSSTMSVFFRKAGLFGPCDVTATFMSRIGMCRHLII